MFHSGAPASLHGWDETVPFFEQSSSLYAHVISAEAGALGRLDLRTTAAPTPSSDHLHMGT